MAEQLPDDLLVDVLARLAPRWLVASRRVCRSWRAAIDGHGLLRPDLHPHSLGGIFLCLHDGLFPVLFARPSSSTTEIPGDLGDILRAMRHTMGIYTVINDHCNDLLLLYNAVLNPATGRWARLPQPPPPTLPYFYDDKSLPLADFCDNMFLVFDPAVSPHYEVLSVPEVPSPNYYPLSPVLKGSEWPPSPWILRVFSLRTGLWEEKPCVREGYGSPIGTIANVQYNDSDSEGRRRRCSAFCRGRLYVQCQNGFVIRINTLTGTYHLIKQPKGGDNSTESRFIGKSKDGVYCASVCGCRLQVWWLDESSDGQPEWVLRCDKDLRAMLPSRRSSRERGTGPWLLRHIHYNDEDDQGKLEWSSDMEDDPESQDGAGGCNGDIDERDRILQLLGQHIDFLGFHPYKEVVFFHHGFERGIAYHLSCSKIQDMGTLSLRYTTESIGMVYPYTPCWMEVFPENN